MNVAFLSIDDGFNNDEVLVPTGHHLFFCGCCCDFRKATMIIDGTMIALQSIMLAAMIFGTYIITSGGTDIYDNLQSQLEKELDDDATIKYYSDMNAATKNLIDSNSDQFNAVSIGASIAMMAVPIVFSAIGLYGAL